MLWVYLPGTYTCVVTAGWYTCSSKTFLVKSQEAGYHKLMYMVICIQILSFLVGGSASATSSVHTSAPTTSRSEHLPLSHTNQSDLSLPSHFSSASHVQQHSSTVDTSEHPHTSKKFVDGKYDCIVQILYSLDINDE